MSAESYPLEDLVSVRKFREVGKSRVVSIAQRQLEEAVQLVKDCEEKAEAYSAWRIEEEKNVYEEIIGEQVKLAALEELKEVIRGFRMKEAAMRQEILDAEKQVSECETALEQAKAEHREAVRDLEKLEEHREVWESEQAVILAKKEVDELDEFRVRVVQ